MTLGRSIRAAISPAILAPRTTSWAPTIGSIFDAKRSRPRMFVGAGWHRWLDGLHPVRSARSVQRADQGVVHRYLRDPTAAQAEAWSAIADGDNTLVIAPTGSGKTLAAFLWAIDRLAESEPRPATAGTRVLYVSPLKALAVDVERNLRTPLTGIGRIAERRGVPAPDISVGVRSGDTTPARRRELITKPPDILITTPESLFLMLTSAARETLAEVQTVIVDEVHAVAGTKRGAHLALVAGAARPAVGDSRRSASGCRRPCARPRRWRDSCRGRRRRRSSRRPRPRRSICRCRCRSRTWPIWRTTPSGPTSRNASST